MHEKQPKHGKHDDEDGDRNDSAYHTLTPSEIRALPGFAVALRLPFGAAGRLHGMSAEETQPALAAAKRFPSQGALQCVARRRAL
jgi:hypothetical protein